MPASLLLLNWKRPANLTRVLAVEAAYPGVAEIMVFNNNAYAAFCLLRRCELFFLREPKPLRQSH
jgi:hypothetical protein